MSLKTNYKLEAGATIASQLQKLASQDPDKPAFVFWDKDRKRSVLTRQEVWDKSRRFAAILRQRWGITKGDVVCNTLVNSPERLITSYGTIVAGAVSMHGQIFLADGEDIVKNLEDSQCKMVILDPHQKKGAMSILEKLKFKDKMSNEERYKGLPYLTHLLQVCFKEDGSPERWFQTLDKEIAMYVDESVIDDDIALIFVTSGSTGFSKLVPHSHYTSLKMGGAFDLAFGVREDSVYFNHRSLGWGGGTPLNYVVFGNTRLLVDYWPGQPDEPGRLFVDMFEKDNCDCGIIFPTDILLILQALDAGARLTKRLRVFGTGGSPISTTSLSAIGKISESITVIYASTEAGLISSFGVGKDVSYENGCCGTPIDFVEVKVFGEDMSELPPGKTGEIFLRSPTLCKKYFNNPKASMEAFPGGHLKGWFKSSDIGHFDCEGRLHVYCRKFNSINHKTYICYPGWMESRINQHKDIQSCIAVGIPDPISHEEICICLTTMPHASIKVADVKEFCKGLFMTTDQEAITPIPKHYLFFDTFPLNINGKVDRMALKSEALKRLSIYV